MAVKETITQELKRLAADCRAEVVVDQLLISGMQWREFLLHLDKFFYRNFSRDIYASEITDSADGNGLLQINLSRTGLYDLLPEGLFFQPAATGKKVKTATDMAEEYKQNKKQELALRNFFVPLENEFFFHRLKNFVEEREFLQGLTNVAINDYFVRFWGLAENISPAMALRITLLLPYIHQVAGDPVLMAAALETIIGEKTSCRIVHTYDQAPAFSSNQLGAHALGTDLICGNRYQEDEISFCFAIGPLKQSEPGSYLQGGDLYETVQSFYRFFVPVSAGIITELVMQPQNMSMIPGSGEGARLGIATVI